MFYLQSKKILVLLSLLLFSQICLAQKGERNLPNYNKKPFHFGFLLGLNRTDFKVKTSDVYASSDTLINSKKFMGFTLGMVMSARISDHFDLRLSPSASFNERQLEFKSVKSQETVDRVVESTVIDIPLMLKYKAQRRHNTSVYLVAGIKPSMALAKAKTKRKNLIRAEGFDVAVEYGVGVEQYFKMFKLAPEIRVSHGLKNVFIKDENDFSDQINGLYNHSISLLLYFE